MLAHALEPADDTGEVVVGLGGDLGLAGDDQRRPRLVDQDRVDLVDDRVGVASLDGGLERGRHVVAQVVEAELGVGAVGDVGRIGISALRERHLVPDVLGLHPERLVDGRHPFGVALGQVVVDGDQVHVRASERIQVERHRRDEGLALTCLHLGDIALVEDDRAHDLDVEVPHAERPLGGLAHGRESLEDELAQVLPVVEPLLELRGLAHELGIRQGLEFRLEGRHVRGLLGQALHAPPLAHAKDLF